MIKNIWKFFDRLEDRIRGKLSHAPIIYALIGSIGIILFWRGVWHLADDFSMSSISSTILGAIILLLSGVFVSAFIGPRLIMSGIKGEKRVDERTEEELASEEVQIKHIENAIVKIEEELSHIEADIHKNDKKEKGEFEPL